LHILDWTPCHEEVEDELEFEDELLELELELEEAQELI